MDLAIQGSTIAGIPTGVVVTTITSLISGMLAAFLTHLLTARRSTREKLWDLRRVAYGTILAELHAVERVLDTALEYISEDEDSYFHGPAFPKYNEIISTHMSYAKQAYTNNYLILSAAFITLYEEFL